MSITVDKSWNSFRRHVLGTVVEESPEPPSIPPPSKSKTWETTIDRVESWPEGAMPLKKHTWISYFFGAGDFVLVLLPVYFILLGIAVISLNGKSTDNNDFGRKVEFAMDLGPTMFPIVFAAISGRSLKMIARYLAEKGARIGTLELLMASQSVWGTVESQIVLQRLTLVGVNLLFLWALSPLGGQASLRLMYRHDQLRSTETKLRYMTTGPGGTMWGLSSTYVGSGGFADAGALYTAALLAPLGTKTGPTDPWGNVKIPRLEFVDIANTDKAGWIPVPSQMQPESYSSLVGLPIVGLPATDNSKLTLDATYLTVDCGGFEQKPYPGFNNTSRAKTDLAKLAELVPGQIWPNKSNTNPFEVSKGQRASFFIDTNIGSPWDPEDPMYDTLVGRLDGFVGHYNSSRLTKEQLSIQREIIYTSVYSTSVASSEFGLNIVRCKLAQKHVEVQVECAGRRCATYGIRESRTDTRPTSLTAFEHGVIMENFAREFPMAVPFSIGSSPTERFLANTTIFPFVQQAGHLNQDVAYTNISLIKPQEFSKRLSLVLNTYYQLTIQPTGYFGGLPQNLSRYGPDTIPVTDINAYLPSNFSATDNSFFDWWPTFDTGVQSSNFPFIGATTTAELTNKQQVFRCSIPWLTLLMTSSTVIFITGLVALVLKRRTLSPEMFGFVTSMTYENPWLKVPHGGTTLDAMERARLLKDVEVHVADVCGQEDIGHIAFAAGVPLRQLERGRLYN
ncbi:hypothetical protein CC86DRAFT_298901 [Ophiobolus disseminans]|uniref:Uncharacterized protein n=1 Tax=Ophiobolus disseminans TaxID=1469910 RepID=A0A6A6ZRX2_9PLEO|nr:hypothetical protein CC86DRAFT_298901 [Ophiobolus disseminans]